MIGRPPRRLGINSAKPKLGQIEFLDKGVDRSNRIVFANPVFQAFRKQRGLPPIRAFDKASHMIPPQIAKESYRGNHHAHNETEGFHTACSSERRGRSRSSLRPWAIPWPAASSRGSTARVGTSPASPCTKPRWEV